MNNRDTILVVFRVGAIFMLFFAIALLPTVIYELAKSEVSGGSIFLKISSLFTILVPLGFIYLLWNKSGLIADKILAPFGKDELWEGKVPISIEGVGNEEVVLEQDPIQEIPEITITHLTRGEVEAIAFSAIAILVLTSSLPELLRFLIGLLSSGSSGVLSRYGFQLLISPVLKTLLAGFLLFKSHHLVAWLAKWRKSEMMD